MNAKQLSADVITYANQCGFPVTNLKLQKTLYYLQGYYAKTCGEELFLEEIEHWPYGPVVPTVYFEYCSFGANAISIPLSDEPFGGFCAEEKNVLKAVVDKCLSLTARELVGKTHKEFPWKSTQASEIIPFNAILHYFKENNPLEISL